MRAIDANVVVRLIVRDDAAQLTVARTLLEEPFLILPTVVLEAVWVLSSTYRLPRNAVSDRMRRLLGHTMARAVAADALLWSLARFEQGADFADMLHLALAANADASDFATFDRGVSKMAHGAPIPITTLT